MFGFVQLLIFGLFVVYHVKTNCPLDKPCKEEDGLICNTVHKYSPQILAVYDAVAVKLPDVQDLAYFQQLKAVSSDFLGVREKPVVDTASADEATAATSPEDPVAVPVAEDEEDPLEVAAETAHETAEDAAAAVPEDVPESVETEAPAETATEIETETETETQTQAEASVEAPTEAETEHHHVADAVEAVEEIAAQVVIEIAEEAGELL